MIHPDERVQALRVRLALSALRGGLPLGRLTAEHDAEYVNAVVTRLAVLLVAQLDGDEDEAAEPK
jgi:hypothetical protein